MSAEVIPMRGRQADPPCDSGAERALIGAALLDARTLDDVTTRPADFWRPAHATIWAAMRDMHQAGRPIDPVTVVARLQQDGDLLKAGGAPYLHTCVEACVSSQSAAWYAATVADKAARRAIIATGTRLVQLGHSEDGDETAERIERARQTVTAGLSDVGTDPGQVVTVAQRLDHVIDGLQQPPRSVTTGLRDLDHMIGGLRPGELLVIGARPGVGKSILAANFALAVARTGVTALIVSLEMSEDEFTLRLLANAGQVDLGHLINGSLTEADWTGVARATQRLADLRVVVQDTPTCTSADIRAQCRAVADQVGNLGLVVVDYVQLLTPRNSRLPRHEQVAEDSRALKLLAREQDIPVVALSQLNRASLQRDGKRPNLGDMRESGSIEQDADVVCLLHTEEDRAGELEVIVAKNRHGTKGSVHCAWWGHFAQIRDLARPWSPSGSVS